MSISTEHEEQTICTDLSNVAISCRWINSSNDAEVGIWHWWSSWKSCTGSAHGVVDAHCIRLTSQFSLPHLLVIEIEGLISILNDEGITHSNWGWGCQSTLLLVFGLGCSISLLLRRLSSSCLGGQLTWRLSSFGGRSESVILFWLSQFGRRCASSSERFGSTHFETWRFVFTGPSVGHLISHSSVIAIPFLADYREFTSYKVVDEHLVQFLGKLQNTTENIHLTLTYVSTMSTSCWRLRRVSWQFDAFVLFSYEVQLPEIT